MLLRISFVLKAALVGALFLALAGCSSAPLLGQVSTTPDRFTPNGDGADDVALIHYSVGARSRVTVYLLDAASKPHYLRQDEPRSPGDYQVKFNGVVDDRVLSNGAYTYIVEATEITGYEGEIEKHGAAAKQQGRLVIADADTNAPKIENPVFRPAVLTPNGDATNDEARVTFRLDKKAIISFYVLDEKDHRYIVDPPHKSDPIEYSHLWDGRSSGAVLKNGKYTYVVEATDAAGNRTVVQGPFSVEGSGTPFARITRVKFSPEVVPQGGTLRVEVTVKNTGDTVLKTLGPDPNTPYTTDQYFTSFRDAKGDALYYERLGVWRVGVEWNTAARPYPVRWGFGRDLQPGEEVTVTGEIQILERQPELFFYATIAQEGVGFLGGQTGQTRIQVTY